MDGACQARECAPRQHEPRRPRSNVASNGRSSTERSSRPILPNGAGSRTQRMGVSELLRWQWHGYAKYHQSRANLLIHIVAVPLFLIGTIVLVAALVQLSLMLLAVALACIVFAVALQGRGHRLEAVPPEPFYSSSSGSPFRAL